MKTYKIAAGAERNTKQGDYFIAIDDGIEPVFVAAVDAGATIRIFQRNREGGRSRMFSATVEEAVIEASGL